MSIFTKAFDFLRTAEDDDVDDDNQAEDETETEPPDDRAVAAMIDKAFADADEKRFFERIEQSCINVDITPADPEWTKKRQEIMDELNAPTKSVKDVMKAHITKPQQLLLLPPLYSGDSAAAVLDIQNYNKELYTEALTNGPFQNHPNNLITKLTMLHFGLPVEVMTLNNVINAGQDNNDPTDDEAEPPRVQRIMFAEKPLEFLDKYYERSHGYPMLRREFFLNDTF